MLERPFLHQLLGEAQSLAPLKEEAEHGFSYLLSEVEVGRSGLGSREEDSSPR